MLIGFTRIQEHNLGTPVKHVGKNSMTLDYATRVICRMEQEEKIEKGTCDMCGEPVQENDTFCKMCGYSAE